MKTKFLFICLSFFTTFSFAQNVGINTTGASPDGSAMLDVVSTNKGFLLPRVALTSTTDITTVTSAANWLIVFNTATASDVTPGMYYWDATKWVRMLANSEAWRTLGNSGTVSTTHFLGTTDNINLQFRTNSLQRFEINTSGQLVSFGLGTAALPTYAWQGDPNTGVFSPGADILAISTNGAEVMRTEADGDVGIGITSALERLHISHATTPNAATIRVSGLSSTSTLTTNATDVMLMVDNNGVMRRSNETVKDAWYTTGNATTALRSIGTTTNQPFQFIANNIARGRVNPADGEFVWGATTSPYAGDALAAVSNATITFAINGYSAQNGSGTWGEILTAGTTAFSAVQGVYGGSGNGAGVLGNYAGTNTSTLRSGVYGVVSNTATGGVGVYGYSSIASGNQHVGVLGTYNGASYGIGVHGIGFGGGVITGNVDAAVVGWRANNQNYSGYFNGNHVIANGTKSASVGTEWGNQLLYVTETPEVWFEDIGRAKLVNGEVTVVFDSIFKQVTFIDDEHPIHVFVQLEGECNDVYVVPGKTGFKVKEKNGGTSNVSFSYRVMAKRVNFQDHRYGSDPVWGEGDTREYMEYAPAPKIDYKENLILQQQRKDNWKQGKVPPGFITYDEIQKQNQQLKLTKQAKP